LVSEGSSVSCLNGLITAERDGYYSWAHHGGA
jgi:hypothetical protein